jgi:hypothetical protein
MSFEIRKLGRLAVAAVLALAFAVPGTFAQDHVVSPSDLQKEVINSTQARQQNVQKVQSLLSTQAGQEAMQSLHANPEQVKNAVSSLDDQELAKLASKADKAQADFAAGTLSNRDLLLIVLAVVVLIVIIIAVR